MSVDLTDCLYQANIEVKIRVSSVGIFLDKALVGGIRNSGVARPPFAIIGFAMRTTREEERR
jgi:hypothetical protein